MSNDISMCSNKECPKKLECYRYMAQPDKFQSYNEYKPEDNCFMSLKENTNE